jgi:hypothetical protein
MPNVRMHLSICVGDANRLPGSGLKLDGEDVIDVKHIHTQQ